MTSGARREFYDNFSLKDPSGYFYNRFIFINRIRNAEQKHKTKFYKYWVLTLFFNILLGSFPHFFGYSLINFFGKAMLIWYIVLLLFSLYFSIRFIILAKKYKVFKKKWMANVFVLGCFCITIAMCISASFTTIYIVRDGLSVLTKMNMFYYCLVFVPLWIGYESFCRVAFFDYFSIIFRENYRANSNGGIDLAVHLILEFL
jgi:hypothetical protein